MTIVDFTWYIRFLTVNLINKFTYVRLSIVYNLKKNFHLLSKILVEIKIFKTSNFNLCLPKKLKKYEYETQMP